MGRIDTNEKQYHQGLQFQEFHHQTHEAPETIEDAPPEEDLYQPPSEHHESVHVTTNTKKHRPQVPSPPSQNDAQAFPPPQEELPQYSFAPPDHQDPHDEPAQAFPPLQDETVPQAPLHHHQYHHVPQQQNVGMGMGMGMQQTNFPHQPVGGIPVQPVGMSPTPLIPQLPNQPWKTHLFDCMKDPKNAMITVLFPCITFGQIAEILDSGSTSCGTSGMLYGLIACCIAMPCIMSCGYRSKMRSRFGLIESPAPDCLVHCFCEYCALCQEYRELKERGFDPSIGWLGNVAKQQQKLQQFGMAPPMQQRMI